MRRAALALLILLPLAKPVLQAQAPPEPASTKKSAFDKPTLEAYLRHQFLLPANLKVEIDPPKPSEVPGLMELKIRVGDPPNPQEVVFYVTKDGQKLVQGLVYDIAQNPFQKNLELLKTDLQPSLGTPGAPVVLVVFSDFQCPYCKEEAKMLRDNLVQSFPTQVRLYFKDFPLEQIHPWARAASVAGRCIFRQNPAQFWTYHDWIFEQQTQINPDNLKSKVLEFAQTKGIDTLQLSQCLDGKLTDREVEKNLADGRALQLNSTPTIFLNGRRLSGQIDWAKLKEIIDHEIEYQKTAHNAGEQACCEVRLPLPVQK